MRDETVICGGEILAEGIVVKRPGILASPVISPHVDNIILVAEQHLKWAVGTLVEQQRIIAEGAGAAGIAAIYAWPDLFAGQKVGVVICGGNIDTRLVGSILNRKMMSDDRLVRVRINISDEPGMLAAISVSIGQCGGNIVEIYQQRMFFDVPAKLTKMDAVIDTRGANYAEEIVHALKDRGFSVTIIKEKST